MRYRFIGGMFDHIWRSCGCGAELHDSFKEHGLEKDGIILAPTYECSTSSSSDSDDSSGCSSSSYSSDSSSSTMTGPMAAEWHDEAWVSDDERDALSEVFLTPSKASSCSSRNVTRTFRQRPPKSVVTHQGPLRQKSSHYCDVHPGPASDNNDKSDDDLTLTASDIAATYGAPDMQSTSHERVHADIADEAGSCIIQKRRTKEIEKSPLSKRMIANIDMHEEPANDIGSNEIHSVETALTDETLGDILGVLSLPSCATTTSERDCDKIQAKRIDIPKARSASHAVIFGSQRIGAEVPLNHKKDRPNALEAAGTEGDDDWDVQLDKVVWERQPVAPSHNEQFQADIDSYCQGYATNPMDVVPIACLEREVTSQRFFQSAMSCLLEEDMAPFDECMVVPEKPVALLASIDAAMVNTGTLLKKIDTAMSSAKEKEAQLGGGTDNSSMKSEPGTLGNAVGPAVVASSVVNAQFDSRQCNGTGIQRGMDCGTIDDKSVEDNPIIADPLAQNKRDLPCEISQFQARDDVDMQEEQNEVVTDMDESKEALLDLALYDFDEEIIFSYESSVDQTDSNQGLDESEEEIPSACSADTSICSTATFNEPALTETVDEEKLAPNFLHKNALIMPPSGFLDANGRSSKTEEPMCSFEQSLLTQSIMAEMPACTISNSLDEWIESVRSNPSASGEEDDEIHDRTIDSSDDLLSGMQSVLSHVDNHLRTGSDIESSADVIFEAENEAAVHENGCGDLDQEEEEDLEVEGQEEVTDEGDSDPIMLYRGSESPLTWGSELSWDESTSGLSAVIPEQEAYVQQPIENLKQSNTTASFADGIQSFWTSLEVISGFKPVASYADTSISKQIIIPDVSARESEYAAPVATAANVQGAADHIQPLAWPPAVATLAGAAQAKSYKKQAHATLAATAAIAAASSSAIHSRPRNLAQPSAQATLATAVRAGSFQKQTIATPVANAAISTVADRTEAAKLSALRSVFERHGI